MKYTVKASPNDTVLDILPGTITQADPVVKIDTTTPPPVVIPPVPPGNKPPVSKAGLDVSINGNYTILNGTASSDPDGTISSYLWTQVSGAFASIHNPTSAICGFGDLKTGVYVFRLAVTDNKGAISTDDVQVTVAAGSVTPPAPPPVIVPPPPVVVPPPPTGAVKYLTLPTGTAQSYSGKNGIVIENLKFGNKNTGVLGGNILHFSGCSNITIRNCYFGSSAGCAIYILDGSSNIKIENCLFAFNRCAVIGSRSTGIYLKNCQQINGYGSGVGDGRDGGILKLIECKGAGFGVESCRVENFNPADLLTNPTKYENNKGLLESNTEDIVSVFASEGTAASPINIINNIIRGGGPSNSGGGIIAGDGTTSFTGGWQNIINNTLYNCGQYGIGLAGGHDITVTGNKIYSDKFPWSNNPLFLWSQYAPAPAHDIIIKGNRVNWTNKSGAKDTGGWNGGGFTNVVNEPSTTITAAEMAVPVHLIDFITPTELLQVRAAK